MMYHMSCMFGKKVLTDHSTKYSPYSGVCECWVWTALEALICKAVTCNKSIN